MKETAKSPCSTQNSPTEKYKKFRFFRSSPSSTLSVSDMTEEEVSYSLIELNLMSMRNQAILEKLYEWSVDTKFYLKNRYLLENILNGSSRASPEKKDIKEIVEGYDTVYVNGLTQVQKQKHPNMLKLGIDMEARAKFMSDQQQFVVLLQNLSESLLEKEKTLEDPEELRSYFSTELQKINSCQAHALISLNKIELVKTASMDSVSSDNQSNQWAITKKQESPLFTMFYHDGLHPVKSINLETSKFVRTKNRFPLILDFHFGKFIYKNDQQLSHELIAMSLIKYLNKLLSEGNLLEKPIVEYEIIPVATGAFYEFVQNSMTIGKIKEKYQGGLPEYIKNLESQYETQNGQLNPIKKRFVESFAGFCMAQYILDLKDRNNENIMIRNDGSIFHIDLAFIFNATPGGINFETAPFKFTQEYLEVLGGFESQAFKYFEELMVSNLTKLTIKKDELIQKITNLSAGQEEIQCFRKYKIDSFKKKFPKKPHQSQEKAVRLIDQSFDNWRTKKYDDYQFKTNGILS